MEEFIKKLDKLFEMPLENMECEGCGFPHYFPNTDEVSEIEGLADDMLITSNGGCNWVNILILKQHGYDVYAGDKDSFGWLTGCIEKDDRVLVYG